VCLVVVAACGGGATAGLHHRCTDLYAAINAALDSAEARVTAGADPAAVATAAQTTLEPHTAVVKTLRQDLAVAGANRRWKWPRTIRTREINSFDLNLAWADDGLNPLRRFAKEAFGGTSWFCNRASSAHLGPEQPSISLLRRIEEGAMRGAIRDIMAAVQTTEERDAVWQYMLEVGLLR
jgi:hypothetical protein